MTPNNNIDPGTRAPSIQFLPTNLNGPQFKWAPNSNIDPRGPGPFHLIFINQFKWAPYNNIDPGGLGRFNSMFVNQFMGLLQQHLNGFQFKWASYNSIDPGYLGLFNFFQSMLMGPLE